MFGFCQNHLLDRTVCVHAKGLFQKEEQYNGICTQYRSVRSSAVMAEAEECGNCNANMCSCSEQTSVNIITKHMAEISETSIRFQQSRPSSHPKRGKLANRLQATASFDDKDNVWTQIGEDQWSF